MDKIDNIKSQYRHKIRGIKSEDKREYDIHTEQIIIDILFAAIDESTKVKDDEIKQLKTEIENKNSLISSLIDVGKTKDYKLKIQQSQFIDDLQSIIDLDGGEAKDTKARELFDKWNS